MALDKAVDSAKLNSALKATADAIRSKTGSTDSVPFDPSTGFKAIIDSMEVGGGGSGGGGESGGGEGATGWEILMPTTNISFVNGGEYLSTENVYPLVSGAVYKVVWDGQVFDELIATDVVFQGMDAIAIGNAGALVGNPSTEPFAIGYIPLANGFGIFRMDGADTTASVEIQKQAKAYTVTFMSENGSELLGTKVVFDGNTCGGLSITPTKESTAQYNYSFYGWATTPNGAADSNALVNITEDKTVYVNFASAVRYYTINYYDGNTLLKTEQLPYGATPSYVPEKPGIVFKGWNPSLTSVTGDADYVAKWGEKITFASGSWSQISEISRLGVAQEYFAVGDTRSFTTSDGEWCTVEIVGFNHDTLASDGSVVGITVIAKKLLSTKRVFNSTQKTYENTTSLTAGGWALSDLRTYLNGEFYNSLPDDVKQVIKTVKKKSNFGYGTYDKGVSITDDNIWIPSKTEINSATSEDHPADGPTYEYTNNDTWRKKSLINVYTDWWTRTTTTTTTNGRVYMVSTKGKCVNYTSADNSTLGVVFGFCV